MSPPVLVQHLRLLLPEGASYRFRRSELRYAPAAPVDSIFIGRSDVGGNEAGQTAAYAEKVAADQANFDLVRKDLAGLQQGLVGGVKPLPVSIPETGKALVFSAVLPPSHVTVELDVKGKAKS